VREERGRADRSERESERREERGRADRSERESERREETGYKEREESTSASKSEGRHMCGCVSVWSVENKRVAVCCSMLQYVAVCCSLLQCVERWTSKH